MAAGSNALEDTDVVGAAISCTDDAVIKRCVAGDGVAWRDLHRGL